MSFLPSLKRLAFSSLCSPIPEEYHGEIQEIQEKIYREDFYRPSSKDIQSIAKVYQEVSQIFPYGLQFPWQKYLNPFFLRERLRDGDEYRIDLQLLKKVISESDTIAAELIVFAFLRQMRGNPDLFSPSYFLYFAARCNAKKSTDLLLQSENLLLDHGKWSFGRTLYFVALYGTTEMLDTFLNHRERLKKIYESPVIFPPFLRIMYKYNLTEIFLHLVEKSDKIDNLKMLLNCPEILNRIPVEGEFSFARAICIAAYLGKSEMLEILLQCKTKFNEIPIQGEFSFSRAVSDAACKGKSNTLQQLLNCKNEVRRMEVIPDRSGPYFGTILLAVAASNGSSILEMILSCEEKMREVPLEGNCSLKKAIAYAEKFERKENRDILIAYIRKNFGETYEPERKRRKIH